MTEKIEIDSTLMKQAAEMLDLARKRSELIAVAESCTGGLLGATLTAIPNCSDCFERGFITYSNASKSEMLGVPAWLIEKHGAVSEDVARAMAGGALIHSEATLAVSITGIAGPDGGTPDKPVGLVHFAAGRAEEPMRNEKVESGDLGREEIRRLSVAKAIELLRSFL